MPRAKSERHAPSPIVMMLRLPLLLAEVAALMRAEGHPGIRGEADRAAAEDGDRRHERHADRPHDRLVRHLIESLGTPRCRLKTGRTHMLAPHWHIEVNSAGARSLATATEFYAQVSDLNPSLSLCTAKLLPSLCTVGQSARDSAADDPYLIGNRVAGSMVAIPHVGLHIGQN